VTEALRSADEVQSACFSPDSRHVVIASWDGTVRIWEAPQFKLPIPAGLPALAEAVVGHRLNEEGSLEFVPVTELLKMKR
jgi:WD40 repeat protein